MLGLFSQGIIEAIPTYKNDKRYGALIVAFPPFNLLTFLCLPVILCCKSPDKLKKINTIICKIAYFPVILISSLIFTISNILMIPLAYFKCLYHKYKLCKVHSGQTPFIKAFWFFLIFGIPLLIITVFTDLYWFIKHSYKWNMTRTREAGSYDKISLRAFNKFYNMVAIIDGERYNAKKLVLEVNETFRVTDCIFGALYNSKKTVVDGD